MKKNYKYLLWDVDDTLIDFKSSEKMTVRECFKIYGVSLTDEDIEIYSEINRNYWELLAQGKIEKSAMLSCRFKDFVQHLSLESIDYEGINSMYQEKLGDYAVMIEDAYEVCFQLKKTKQQYAVTNGTIVAQNKKLDKTGLRALFDGVFISDEVGYEKPDLQFFRCAFDNIAGFKREEAILIGDSLSSDIMGANNAGIDCCWFNPKGKVNENSSIKIQYEIKKLKELLDIVV
ncbi:MAG: YjjG family noncanonical pyrimidine nucleotidase [Bacillota bacterium]